MPQTKLETNTKISKAATIGVSITIAISSVALFISGGMIAFTIFIQNASFQVSSYKASKIICSPIPVPQFFDLTSLDVQAEKVRLKESTLKSLEHLQKIQFRNKENTGTNLLQYLNIQESEDLKFQLSLYKNSYVNLMRSKNPEQAFDLTFPPEFEALIHQVSEDCIPKPVQKVSGTLIVEHADDFENNRGENRMYLTRENTPQKQAIHLAKVTSYLESSMTLEIESGYEFNNEILARSYNIIAEPESPQVLGPQRVIAIKILPDHLTQYPYTNEEIANIIFGPNPPPSQIPYEGGTLDEFYRANSYDKIQLTGEGQNVGTANDVYPHEGAYPIHIPYYCSLNGSKPCNPEQSNSCGAGEGRCVGSCDMFSFAQSAIDNGDTDILFEDNARIISIVPEDTRCSIAGFSFIGKIPLATDEGDVSISTSYTQGLDRGIMAHETGHMFGLNHANFLRCETQDTPPELCENIEYGDYIENMGGLGGNIVMGHINSAQKNRLGWLDAGDPMNDLIDLTVSEPGTVHNYTLKPLGSSDPGVKAIKLLHGGEDWPNLFIEYRKPVGIDERVGAYLDNHSQNNPNIFSGALLRLNRWRNESNLFDPQFLEGETNAFSSALPFGEIFIDPSTLTRVDLREETEEGLPLSITIGPRTDFEGPTNVVLREVSRPNSCTIRYQASAEDPSGISKVEFLLRDAHTRSTEIINIPNHPAEVDINLNIYTRWFMRVRVFDNANNDEEYGIAPNNWSESDEIRIPLNRDCDSVPPIVSLNFPEYNYSYTTEEEIPTMTDTRYSGGARYIYNTYNISLPFNVRSPFLVTLNVRDINYIRTVILEDERILPTDTTSCGLNVCNHFYVSTLGQNNSEYLADIPIDTIPGDYHFYIVTEDRFNNNSIVNFTVSVLRPLPFTRGDTNGDGNLNIVDAIQILDYLFLGNVKNLGCFDAADANDSGEVDISDAQHLINYMFLSEGVEPRPPFLECGSDPTPDNLGCTISPLCE